MKYSYLCIGEMGFYIYVCVFECMREVLGGALVLMYEIDVCMYVCTYVRTYVPLYACVFLVEGSYLCMGETYVCM